MNSSLTPKELDRVRDALAVALEASGDPDTVRVAAETKTASAWTDREGRTRLGSWMLESSSKNAEITAKHNLHSSTNARRWVTVKLSRVDGTWGV